MPKGFPCRSLPKLRSYGQSPIDGSSVHSAMNSCIWLVPVGHARMHSNADVLTCLAELDSEFLASHNN